jgi:hypothetical protein
MPSGVDQELLDEIAADRERRLHYSRNYKREKRANDPEQRKRESAYSRQYNAVNLDKVVARNKERYKRHKLRAVEYKGNMCADCGGTFHHAVFDFHHIDSREPDLPDTWLARGWERIVTELDKCVMLCANCHRIRHHDSE